MEPIVLAEALINAIRILGIPHERLNHIIGCDLIYFIQTGIEPNTKNGEIAILVIRCYHSLYALAGGNQTDMQHWMQTYNYHTHGIPAVQISNRDSLIQVVEYLEALSH